MGRVKDADMTSRRRAIALAEFPAYPLGPLSRHAHTQAPSWPEHAHRFLKYAKIVGNVLQNFTGDYHINRIVCHGERRRIARRKPHHTAGRMRLHIGNASARSGKVTLRQINTDREDTVQQISGQCVPPLTTAHIQTDLARCNGELI